MTFTFVEHAYLFYGKYAEEASFGIKKYREKTYIKWLVCTREGASATSNSPVPKERNRGTKRGGVQGWAQTTQAFGLQQGGYISNN